MTRRQNQHQSQNSHSGHQCQSHPFLNASVKPIQVSLESRVFCDNGYLLTSCFVLGHMARHVPDGCGRILQVRIRQLVVVRRKETTAIQMTEVVILGSVLRHAPNSNSTTSHMRVGRPVVV